LSQFTRLTDRRTDGETDRHLSHRYTASALHAAQKKPIKRRLYLSHILFVSAVVRLHSRETEFVL